MQMIDFAMVVIKKNSALTILNPGQTIPHSMGPPSIRPNGRNLPIDETTVLEIESQRDLLGK